MPSFGVILSICASGPERFIHGVRLYRRAARTRGRHDPERYRAIERAVTFIKTCTGIALLIGLILFIGLTAR